MDLTKITDNSKDFIMHNNSTSKPNLIYNKS